MSKGCTFLQIIGTFLQIFTKIEQKMQFFCQKLNNLRKFCVKCQLFCEKKGKLGKMKENFFQNGKIFCKIDKNAYILLTKETELDTFEYE